MTSSPPYYLTLRENINRNLTPTEVDINFLYVLGVIATSSISGGPSFSALITDLFGNPTWSYTFFDQTGIESIDFNRRELLNDSGHEVINWNFQANETANILMGDISDIQNGTTFQIWDGGTVYVFNKPNIRIDSVSYVFPGTQGDDGTVLGNDGSGNLSWTNIFKYSNGATAISYNGINEVDISAATFSAGGTNSGILIDNAFREINIGDVNSNNNQTKIFISDPFREIVAETHGFFRVSDPITGNTILDVQCGTNSVSMGDLLHQVNGTNLKILDAISTISFTSSVITVNGHNTFTGTYSTGDGRVASVVNGLITTVV